MKRGNKEDLAADMEVAQAAELWVRLVAIIESDDGPTKAYDHEIVEKIVALVDEWQGFVGKKEPG